MPGINFEVRGGTAFSFFALLLAAAFLSHEYAAELSVVIMPSMLFFVSLGPLSWLQDFVKIWIPTEGDDDMDEWSRIAIGIFSIAALAKWILIGYATFLTWEAASKLAS
jgi:hypothetical protein